jgi:hypothetical protein
MTFYAGELLWTQERWKEAGAMYRRIRKLDPDGKYAIEAENALNSGDLDRRPARRALVGRGPAALARQGAPERHRASRPSGPAPLDAVLTACPPGQP